MKKDFEHFKVDTYRMLNVYKSFFNYCEKEDVKLLKGDVVFIKKTVSNLTQNPDMAKKILYKYFKVYKDTCANEPDPLKKEGSGRREANMYLLKLLDT